jgi:hypothetical protein
MGSTSPGDVAFFFVFCTNFDHHDFEEYFVLHIGDGEMRAEVDSAVRDCVLNGEAL